MTRQFVKQCRTVEQHIWNYEHDLAKQWHLLAHMVR